MNILPMFFPNMENIEKNILAVVIIILSINILMKIAFKLDTKIDRYLILGLYLLVLVMGLLRPDQQNFFETGLIALNPFGFISDIKMNESSILTMVVNLVIFIPMYFLLTHANIFRNFFLRFLSFELFVFVIEYLQFELGVGVFDLSDIFLYNLGFFVGYFISLPFLNILKKSSYNQKLKGDMY